MVILMISLSLWGLLFMEGIYDGMTEQMITNAIRSDCGDLTIYAKDYRLERKITQLIPDHRALKRRLDRDPRVRSTNTRILQDGLVATAHYSRNCLIIGISPKSEKKHGQLDNYLIAGHFDFGRRNNGAIIGAKLARKLKIGVGKKIILSAQDTQNEVSAISLKVRGLLRTNNMLFDEMAVLIDQNKAAQMLSTGKGISQISILLHDEQALEPLQKELQARQPRLAIFRWDEIYPALLQGRVMMKGFNMVTNLIVFCVAGLGIFGVMLVSIMERLREFGILLAVGTSFRQICWMVIGESLVLGSIGFMSGAVLGGTTLFYFHRQGLDLSLFSEGLETFGVDSITYALIRPEYFLYSLLAVILATLISVILPLRMLKKANPVEAIHTL